ncbi:MAG: hypothetical protein Q8R28_14195 [Dehalococcoidia bacterium]|nr:hypothetical protein [Dehalococcoidia bacterium]
MRRPTDAEVAAFLERASLANEPSPPFNSAGLVVQARTLAPTLAAEVLSLREEVTRLRALLEKSLK